MQLTDFCRIQTRLEQNGRKVKLDVDEPAQDWLASAGYSRECFQTAF